MRVGFLQFEPIFGEVEANLKRVDDLLRLEEADLVVLPELFSTGYLFSSREEALTLAEEIPRGRTTQFLLRLARRLNMHLVGGVCEREGRLLYNSAVLVSPGGYIGKYRKIHLFSEEKLWFRPGDLGFPVFNLGAFRLGIMICFDWLFPEAARTLALKGAQIICHPANLILPYCQQGMSVRCLENGVFAITANRTGMEKRNGKSLTFTGKSQITGPRGEILTQAGEREETLKIVPIDPHRADDKSLNPLNNLFQDRRVDDYKILLWSEESLS